ncbi:hypothetical protein [Gordonia sp. (in: high G+C Gram-positive bacteria)]|uniref:hypothetical protein n=1 Tax=Gordonia sp. (in: high G+C Gram-positive bacteria) TaxID=84139 RepID=UPI0039E50F34
MLANSPIRSLATVALAGVLAAGLTACGSDDGLLRTPSGSIISTVTSRMAQADVVNAERDYTQTCLAPTAPDPGLSDVTRVVVTDPVLLDAGVRPGGGREGPRGDRRGRRRPRLPGSPARRRPRPR